MKFTNTPEEVCKLGYIPACIKRVSDGALLLLNDDGTYSFESKTYIFNNRYKLTSLCNEYFEVVSWIKKSNFRNGKINKIVNED